MIKEVILILVVLTSIPLGYLLAWLCSDELVVGRKWFKMTMIISFIFGIVFLFLGDYVIALTMLFFLLCTSVSLIKSFDKKWIKRRL